MTAAIAGYSRFRTALLITATIHVSAPAHSGDYSKYPEGLTSRRDIARASEKTDNVWVGSLPLDDYPALAKFAALKRVRFQTREGNGADDEKLRALAATGFTNLFDFGLLNCPQVTDREYHI
jgi:hypothetical protein